MKVKFGEWILNELDIENEEYKYSNLYDVELHKFDMVIQVKGSSLDKFKKILEESCDGGIYKLDENDEVMSEYKVYSKSHSYRGKVTNEDTIYSYSLSFEEVIKKNLESLDIGKLNVVPYMYEEEDDNAIIINAKIQLSKEEMDMFKSIEDGERYFNVVRNGISNKIVKMRFGKNIWSEKENIFNVSIVLVEDIYDKADNKSHGLLQAEIQNIMDMLAYHRNLNNELINLLLAKNILTDNELYEVKSKAEKDINDAHRQFYKVNDIDKY